MVNWQFYGKDDKSSTPPPIQKTKLNWTGIPVGILICVGMIKFIGGEMKTKSTNSVVKEPFLYTFPVNFVPTNNDYLIKTSPKLKSTIPKIDLKFNNTHQYDLQKLNPYVLDNPNELDALLNQNNIVFPESLLNPDNSINLLNTKIKTNFKHNKGLDLDNSLNSSFPKIKTDIIPENSFLNQQNSFDSKTKINGSLD